MASTTPKLGIRMLLTYPGLTFAGGLALAIAIGLGAGYWDFMGEFMRPRLPLPAGDRIVEVELRNTSARVCTTVSPANRR